MSVDSANREPDILRIWPAVGLVALLWLVRSVPRAVDEVSMAILAAGLIGPLVCSLLILVWWLVASRASRREKMLGLAGLLVILLVTTLLAHPTVRGYGTIGTAVPWGFTAFVAGLVVSRWWQALPRVAVALLAATLGFGIWSFVRMDGVWGDFQADRAWRWEETAEERYLSSLEAGTTSSDVVQSRPDALPIGTEWPGFRGPQRDAVVPGVTLGEDWDARPPRELWRIDVGPGWSSFAVSGRRLITQEQRGKLEMVVAYDTETGAELWTQKVESRFFEAMGGVGPRATPTVAGDMLFTVGAEGLVHRLEPTTGRVVWQTDLRRDAEREPPTWGFASSPLVVDDLVIVHAGGEGDRGILAYGVEDGRVHWGAPAGGHSYSSPHPVELQGTPAVMLTTDAGLTAVDPVRGSVTWNYDWPLQNYRAVQPLVVDGSTVLISSGLYGTRRVDVTRELGKLTASESWTSNAMKPDFNDFVFLEGFLYGFDAGILACIDLESGQRQWKGGRYGAGQLLLLPDSKQLLVLSEKGDLVLVRATPERHEELTRLAVFNAKTWNHPVLVGDRLYLRNAQEAVALEMPLIVR